jgi:hypothetical protein
LTALPSYSIVQAKDFSRLVAAQSGLSRLQAASRHLNIVELFDAGLD